MKKQIRNLLLATLILLFTQSIFAMPLEEYKVTIFELQNIVYTKINEPESEDFTAFTEAFESRLKPMETVKFSNTDAQVNNQPILDLVEKVKTASLTERPIILFELNERLLGIGLAIQQISGLEGAAENKNELKRSLNLILSGQNYHPASREEGAMSRIWKAIKRWLESFISQSDVKRSLPTNSFGNFTKAVNAFLYLVVIAFICFIGYRFFPIVRRRLRKRSNKESEKIILGEKIAAHKTSSTIFSEAEMLARQGDLRLAVRKGYIALLNELGEKREIRITASKTNRDYLRELQKNSPLREPIREITNDFERHWYGNQSVDQKDWDKFRSEYRQVVSQIGGTK